MMYGENRDSTSIVSLIPKDSVGVEIGVWRALTTQKFLLAKPKKIYAIDPWSIEPYKMGEHYQLYLDRYERLVGSRDPKEFMVVYERVYQEAVRRVGNNSICELCRMTSDSWFALYKDVRPDWIYVDGDHSYDAVLKDLNNCLNVIKKGGMILGDCYLWDEDSSNDVHKIQVTAAVNRFIRLNDLPITRYGVNQYRIDV